MASLIYQITNTITNQKYIGWTKKTAKDRFKVHCQCAKRGDKSYLYNSIRKYNEDNFIVEELERGNDDVHMLKEREPYYISQLSKKERLNITNGGYGGVTSTSFKKGQLPWNTGKKAPKIAKARKEYWIEWRKEHPNYKDKWKVNTVEKLGFTEQERKERSKRISKINQKKIKCPHCSVIGNLANMKRWHFDKCNDSN